MSNYNHTHRPLLLLPQGWRLHDSRHLQPLLLQPPYDDRKLV